MAGIYIGIGANLSSPRHGPPLATCRAAVVAIAEAGVAVRRRSRWYCSLPVPLSDQPPFVNGVLAVSTDSAPLALLALLHRIEADFGRTRSVRNAARLLDLDLLAYDDMITEPAAGVVLPHPRLHQRAFVLRPLAELAPNWRHPVTGLPIEDLVAALPPDQYARPLPERAPDHGEIDPAAPPPAVARR